MAHRNLPLSPILAIAFRQRWPQTSLEWLRTMAQRSPAVDQRKDMRDHDDRTVKTT